MDVEWSDVDVYADREQRWGKTREYFGMRLYRLPVSKIRPET
jgi:type IV protein arginine methyltransferase